MLTMHWTRHTQGRLTAAGIHNLEGTYVPTPGAARWPRTDRRPPVILTLLVTTLHLLGKGGAA